MPKTLLAWSSGKDSAWALHVLRKQGIEVAALLTTFDGSTGRSAMHSVPMELVEAQAEAAGLPFWPVLLPWPCSNVEYEALMADACRRAELDGYEAVAFGDLYLPDIRTYREQQLAKTNLQPLFPLWEMPTRQLAAEMIAGGLRARLTCIDRGLLLPEMAGREFDAALLQQLPSTVDPCGENGEFHTFVFDGPMFRHPVPVQLAGTRQTNNFVYADLVPA